MSEKSAKVQAGWTVPAPDLVAAVNTLEMVPGKSGLQSSQYIMVQMNEKLGKLVLCLTADVAAVVRVRGKGQWPFDKPFYIDRRLFCPFVLVGKDAKADFEFSTSKIVPEGKRKKTEPITALVVRQGRRRAVFNPLDSVTGYAQSSGVKEDSWKLVLDGTLLAALQCARACATHDTSHPELNCVHLTGSKEGLVKMYGYSKILFNYNAVKVKATGTARSVPMPLFLIDILTKDHTLHIGQKAVVLKMENGEVWQSVSAIARKKFPIETLRAHATSKEKPRELFRIPANRLSALSDRLAIYLSSVRRQDWLLRVKGKKGDSKLLFESEIPQTVFKEMVPCDKALGDDLDIIWPLDLLVPIFSFIGESLKDKSISVSEIEPKKKEKGSEEEEEGSPYYLRCGNFLLVIARAVLDK